MESRVPLNVLIMFLSIRRRGLILESIEFYMKNKSSLKTHDITTFQRRRVHELFNALSLFLFQTERSRMLEDIETDDSPPEDVVSFDSDLVSVDAQTEKR